MRHLRFIGLIVGILMSTEAYSDTDLVVWLGTRGQAIYRATLDDATGKLSNVEAAAKIQSPGFLCTNAAGTLLYSLGTPEGQDGNVAVYRIGDQASLELLGHGPVGLRQGHPFIAKP